MSYYIKCPHCQIRIDIDQDLTGEKVQCFSCEKKFFIEEVFPVEAEENISQVEENDDDFIKVRPSPVKTPITSSSQTMAPKRKTAAAKAKGKKLSARKPVPMMPKKSSPLPGLIVFLMILGVGGFFGYKFLIKDKKTIDSENNKIVAVNEKIDLENPIITTPKKSIPPAEEKLLTKPEKITKIDTPPPKYIKTKKPDYLIAPELDDEIPSSLDLPSNFKPAKKGRKNYLGIHRMSGFPLEKQQGIYPLYVMEIHKNSNADEIFNVGDIILAINGQNLGKNPDRKMRKLVDEAKKTTGVVWVTRWRKGKTERILIDLGNKPQDLVHIGKPGPTRDWRLGPIGANGWCFHKNTRNGASSLARQIIITAVDKDSPATGKLEVNDVILGAYGKFFDYDARKALAAAINEAEKEENKGELKLLVWRPSTELRTGKQMEITLNLPVLGTYSSTAPFNCPKTEKIIDNAVAYMKKNKKTLLDPKNQWLSFINGLGLLATGREDVMPMVKELAHSCILKPDEKLSIQKHVSMMCWWWSYRTVFLCEYYLRTGDKAVLPTIEEYATKIAMGQSGAGTWGHTYAAIENTGKMHGPLGGYGAINQQGLTCMIALPLAVKCGIRNKEVMDAIKRGDDFFKYFIGKGTIPYGDHGPAAGWFDDNGKSGSAAIFFDLMKNRKGTKFFSEMVLGSTPGGREAGHTGHFWSHLWGGIGAARGGEKSLQVFMKEMNPIFTLERQPDGRFVFQENAGENGKKGDPKKKWDSTGARLLQLCFPKRKLYITGKETPKETHLTQARIEEILRAGRLDVDKDARAKLELEDILKLLEDPLPPTRAMAAQTLAERNINCVDKLIPMLDSDNKYARYGAAQALCKAGFGNKQAADKLIKKMAESDDINFKIFAIDALINRDKERGLLTVAKPAIPVLLKMAVQHSPDDPRKVLHQEVARALFYNGNAQPRRGLLPEYGLECAPKELLIPAMKEILTNQNGGARSLMAWVYPKLDKDEINQLWGDIYESTRHIAPSGIMFASGIRTSGLNAMADNHIKEGLPLAAWYIRYQKGHGAPKRIPKAIEAILKYGPYAKTVIPELKKHLAYFESKHKKGRPVKPDSPIALIKEAIKKIEAMSDKPKFKLISIKDQIKKTKH